MSILAIATLALLGVAGLGVATGLICGQRWPRVASAATRVTDVAVLAAGACFAFVADSAWLLGSSLSMIVFGAWNLGHLVGDKSGHQRGYGDGRLSLSMELYEIYARHGVLAVTVTTEDEVTHVEDSARVA